MLDAVPATPTVAAVAPGASRGAARRRAPRALVAAALLGPLAILLPVGFTLYRAATLGAQDALDLLWRPLVGELLVNTLLITLASTLACAALGTAVAWCVERTTLPLRPLWAALAAAPLAVPPFVTSYAWVSISVDLQDFVGALIVLSAAYFPLVYLPVAAALRELDPALEESARTLGCSPRQIFMRVVLPQLRPALYGGMLLVALGVLSEFGAFQLLRFRTFTTGIYAEYRTSFDGGGASLFGCVLIALCLVCVAVEARVRGRTRYGLTHRAARRAALRYELGAWRGVAVAGFVALTAATLGVPLATIGYWLTQQGAAAVTPADVSPALLWHASLASAGYGLAGAALTTLLALPIAFLLARFPGRVATAFERIVMTAQGVPGIVIALALVSLTVRLVEPLYQSAPMLIGAYAILFLPLAVVSVRAAFLHVQQQLEETARALGLGWRQTFMRVVLPLVAPGLGAAATMVFISVVTELNATLLLSPTGTRTLATQVWSDTSQLAFAAAAPYAALLVALSLGASVVLFLLLGRASVRA
ncbi:ABC transporter permease [Burkholderia ubonensis]|uniref:Iron ABC transporter permease n=1 Tax=Burkholderia ubonensis TaxID=101571 RepID=A0AAW3N8L4_9BURK|nr:iron ABC transporter permease [Burkholderia ubonensis]KVT47134.1 iron ABC transporter permease [Burkholderia ubonensis]